MNQCEICSGILQNRSYLKNLPAEKIYFTSKSKSYLIAFIASSSQPVRNDTPPNGVIIANNFIEVTE